MWHSQYKALINVSIVTDLELFDLLHKTHKIKATKVQNKAVRAQSWIATLSYLPVEQKYSTYKCFTSLIQRRNNVTKKCDDAIGDGTLRKIL